MLTSRARDIYPTDRAGPPPGISVRLVLMGAALPIPALLAGQPQRPGQVEDVPGSRIVVELRRLRGRSPHDDPPRDAPPPSTTATRSDNRAYAVWSTPPAPSHIPISCMRSVVRTRAPSE